ncbi:phenylacetate--CoA ligase family protein [Arthrobacter sp. STN4]|uniref:phenylacetate--CoA ligase family protein n=1 Tax=Arthrobacter sp. STN4 TaxID=2923276 RepID=UPI00211A0847|nr:hypothetical protein [Arthrobacter sp. STN4]MCQ9165476.1 hypothetical protein [Arthrobacter sp. STN4]
MRYANEALNSLDEQGIRKFQEKRMLAQLSYCLANSDFYRRRFADLGIDPKDVRTLDDYQALPVIMDKQQERISQQESIDRHRHPFGAHLCCSPRDIGLAATTSGTTGDPTFSYTLARSDLLNLAEGFSYFLSYAGLTRGDRAMFCHSLGIYATSSLLPPIRSAGILPIDVDVRGGAEAILKAARLTFPDALMTTPSLAEHLITRMPETIGIEPKELGLTALFTVGEIAIGIPHIRQKLQDAYGCRVYDWTAPMGQTLAFSCDSEEYFGMHAVTPDLDLYPLDLIDVESREPLEIHDGVIGEAMYTSLSRHAVPVLRYASGDVVQVFTEPCPGCGFRGPRVKVVGRSDDMLIVKGSNVYPGAIKKLVAEFAPAVTGEMRIILDTPPPRVEPPLRIRLEFGSDTREGDLPGLASEIGSRLSSRLHVKPEITWHAPGTLPISMTKTPLFEKNY